MSGSHTHTVKVSRTTYTTSSSPVTPEVTKQQYDDLAARVTKLEQTAPLPPPNQKVVNVQSIADLKSVLADDTVDVVNLAAGTYRIDGSGNQTASSLWIGTAYAGRTRPITVHTLGPVVFDLAGGYAGGISINGGANKQTWDGDFTFINGVTTSTGVIVWGGYAGMNAPHDFTLRGFKVAASCVRGSDSATDHAMYFSYALDTWANILVENFSVDASGAKGLCSAIHRDHGGPADAPLVNAHGVTVRNLSFLGNGVFPAQQAILLWTPAIRDWLFDGAKLQKAGNLGIRFEATPAQNIVFKDIVSDKPFYSQIAAGSPPSVPGVTFQNCTPSGFTP